MSRRRRTRRAAVLAIAGMLSLMACRKSEARRAASAPDSPAAAMTSPRASGSAKSRPHPAPPSGPVKRDPKTGVYPIVF